MTFAAWFFTYDRGAEIGRLEERVSHRVVEIYSVPVRGRRGERGDEIWRVSSDVRDIVLGTCDDDLEQLERCASEIVARFKAEPA